MGGGRRLDQPQDLLLGAALARDEAGVGGGVGVVREEREQRAILVERRPERA
jgi:hypothetical protein